MALPTAKQQPTFNFFQEKILLYGDWKVGKTSLVAALPFDVLFMATERGHSKVDAFVQEILTWTAFQETIAALREDTKFQMAAIDTIDALWYLYLEHFKRSNNVDWEGDMKWGKGHALLVRGFVAEFMTLQSTGKGFIMLAHAKPDGDEGIIRPNLPYDKNSQIRDTICGLCDYILYMRMETSPDKQGNIAARRVLRTAPTDEYVAGARWPLYDPIPLVDGDPAQSAVRLVNAYKKSAPQKATEPTQKPKEGKVS